MEPDDISESIRLKSLSEQKFNSSNLKSALKYAKRAHRLSPTVDGVSEMLTALKILRVAAKSGGADAETPQWYKILQVEPFCHINTIKKQYKKLALVLHPDKNSFVGSGDAFKLVGDAFRVLSDRIRRKEYDMKLRIAMQAAVEEGGGGGGGLVVGDTFWTACSTCRLLHQFERKYLGHNLMCPSCKKSFEAVEVRDCVGSDEKEDVQTRVSARIRMRKMSSVGDILKRTSSVNVDNSGNSGDGGVLVEGLKSKKVVSFKDVKDGAERSGGVKVDDRSKRQRVESVEETMTLAEIQLLVKKKANDKKLKSKLKGQEKEKDTDMVKGTGTRSGGLKSGGLKSGDSRSEKRIEKRNGDLEVMDVLDGGSKGTRSAGMKSGNSRSEKRTEARNGDMEVMAVVDADFYDFDKGRVERSFKKGQVWAIYDDDDGMPRHYGLINQVISTHPFEVEMSWLDFQSNGDEGLAYWEKRGFHVSCGRFKVSQKTSIKALNVFSHIMDCERAAREIYRIYPKKGSVWALYKENALDSEGRNSLVKGKRCYDIVVFLTSYSEMHGLSMAYLEKVIGFKTVFKRKEIGCHAIRWLEKDDVRLFSHQIPARKLSGEEDSDLSKDCWELDPASLPPELLTIGGGR